MSDPNAPHFVTVGWGLPLIERLWRRMERISAGRFSHVPHPRHAPREWNGGRPDPGVRFIGLDRQTRMPEPDLALLGSLERAGVPTVRNMILGDRVVSRLAEQDALGYATFLARRFARIFEELEPTAVIGGYDAVHNGISLGVARSLGIPWFALHFSVIPPGMAGFCNAMSPSARVQLPEPRSDADSLSLAEATLAAFESRSLQAPAYLAPPPPSFGGSILRIPGRIAAAAGAVRRSMLQSYLRYTDDPGRLNPGVALRNSRRAARARSAVAEIPTLAAPPGAPFALFGLHTQPESSIDVWAPFFSNQQWVIETIARALPAGMRLLVKIHKSDVSRYTRDQLGRMRNVPGVEIIRPFADARAFIDGASLVFAIQGTMALEAALLRKPVVVLGDSPVTVFPWVSQAAALSELPDLVRRALSMPPPERPDVIEAFARYLGPFRPAAHNDWRIVKSDREIESFAELFRLLKLHVAGRDR